VASSFGEREDPIDGEGAFHSGIDIDAPNGTPVRAAADGNVTGTLLGAGYGRQVVLNHGHDLITLYGHLSAIAVVPGQHVTRGPSLGVFAQELEGTVEVGAKGCDCRFGVAADLEPEHFHTSDKAWMPTWLAALDREVPTDAWKQALYVTDSAGITPAHLDQCAALDVRWLGRLPETYTLAREVKAAAWAAPDTTWEDLGTFSPRTGAAHYRVQIHPGTLATYPVRCVVVHSDALDRRRERTLQREIATEAAARRTAAAALARQVFACVADAEAAHAVAVKAAAPRWHAVTPTVVAETVVRRGRGRPRLPRPCNTACTGAGRLPTRRRCRRNASGGGPLSW
jgi:hypothetical protein